MLIAGGAWEHSFGSTSHRCLKIVMKQDVGTLKRPHLVNFEVSKAKERKLIFLLENIERDFKLNSGFNVPLLIIVNSHKCSNDTFVIEFCNSWKLSVKKN